jgi:hypothetical protein
VHPKTGRGRVLVTDARRLVTIKSSMFLMVGGPGLRRRNVISHTARPPGWRAPVGVALAPADRDLLGPFLTGQ